MRNASPAPSPAARGIQFKLIGATSLGVLLLVVSALAGLASAWFDLGAAMPASYSVSRDAEQLQREFRLQVQEWKNVLLRGADDALREKHASALAEEGRKVAALAAKV
ncbi:MAG: methyl-accepting chemotaxis protein, partial [Stenotrophomonas sp.]|nr:methyl-accepting chemotaxis protein [Stenotrophomonas sp.]